MNSENARKKRSLDKDWSFHLGDVPAKKYLNHGEIYGTSKAGSKMGPPQNDFDARDWRILSLPHDFMIELPFDKEGAADWGYKPKETAWYRKCFSIDEKEKGNQILLEFDGIATHSTIYFNGSIVKRNWSAYNGFSIDVTDRVFFGGTPNTLAVFVDATKWEGWWYEGGGIYRHAWLTIKPPVNIKSDGVYVNPIKVDEITWNTNIEISLVNTSYEDKKVKVRSKLYNKSEELLGEGISVLTIKAYSEIIDQQTLIIEKPLLWDIESPNLYHIKTEVINEGSSDKETTYFGYRTIKVDPDKGFFLNDRNIKLYGTCNHQDHAGVGVAVPDALHEYRVMKLKEMGSNAYRCAHGMPAKEFLDACDRLGMLVMDENRNFETSEEGLEQLRAMVLRDRNHPSIIMYSIFNEEPLQGTYAGKMMANRMLHEIKKNDDTRFITAAMHGGVLDKESAGQVLDVMGINYQPASYDSYHERNPLTPIVASETTSAFSVRGCYQNDEEKHRLASFDENASSWGNTIRDTWNSIKDRDFVMGAFMWTGFDYLGEPTPYTYPSISSYFGMLDTCGFEKEGFYLCKAFFSKEPFCHVLPHWNYKEGDTVKVMSHTNCEEAEVFVNGVSYGRKETILTKQAYWEIPYTPGTLELVGFLGDKEAARDIVMTTGKESKLIIKPSRNIIYNDGSDAIPFNIYAVDDKMRMVPFVSLKTKIDVIEGGELLGTGNGDPTCLEDFKGNTRSLFAGKCQAIIRAKEKAERLVIKVTADGLEAAVLTLPLVEKTSHSFVPSIEEQHILDWYITGKLYERKPEPIMKTSDFDMNSFEPISVANGEPEKFRNQEGKYAIYRTKVQFPDKINGRSPILHFQSIWGDCEIYVNGEQIGSCNHEWPGEFDVYIKENHDKETEIIVLVRSCNFGAGICSNVVIR